jgi:hypothetical protein
MSDILVHWSVSGRTVLIDRLRQPDKPLRVVTASEAVKESLCDSHYFVIVPITLPGKEAIASFGAIYGSTDGSSEGAAESRCRTI